MKGFIDTNCTSCHDKATPDGGLDLSSLTWNPSDPKNFAQWVEVFDRVNQGEMPPVGEARPPAALQTASLGSLRAALIDVSRARREKEGRVGMRRLNRVEYEKTLHHLLDIDAPLKEILPEENAVGGFDTVAEGLRISPLHLEKYLEAADTALDLGIRLTRKPEKLVQRFIYKEQEGVKKNLDSEHALCLEVPNGIVMFGDASYITKIFGLRIPQTGLYRIRASGFSHKSQKPTILQFYAGNYRQGSARLVGYFDMPISGSREVDFVTKLEASEYFYPAPADLIADPDTKKGLYNVGAKNWNGSGTGMEWIEFEGPLGDTWPPAGTTALFPGATFETNVAGDRRKWDPSAICYDIASKDPRADAAKALTAFAVRAFRRPLAPGEIDRFLKLSYEALDAGQSFDKSVRVGLRAILVAPQFLMLEEHPGRLDDYALAARLSYFLWSSLPDDELIAVAAAKKLSQPAVLRAQTERLLASPKARAFTENFVGQWLELRNIDATAPDARMYPEYDPLLRISMIRETEDFFTEVLREDLGVANFIHSDFAIINRRLADHYKIAGVEGEQFRKVKLPADSHRGGLLTQASILKVTANGTVTSPVLRGAWVMKHLLGQPPAPPPADVGSIEPDTRGTTTVREQLAKHRSVESCNTCHRTIDPPGFALENFDVIGSWRERYRSQGKGDQVVELFRGKHVGYKHGPAVDASGDLPDGAKFKNIDDFKKYLLTQTEQVARALTNNLLAYGTGATVEFADREAVEKILHNARSRNYGFRTLVHEVVQSELFQTK
ncbi:MAG: DUF1592 domain-containing protein [Planctomycetia bacterium]|nr:DUF1592 domain-containing protein [Planctomycetia bacterium]